MYLKTIIEQNDYILTKEKGYYNGMLREVYVIRKIERKKQGYPFWIDLSPPEIYPSLRKAKINFLLISI